MALEHFKTQVLLLHSEQSTLDILSAGFVGFNDRYTVHFATSGTEALNTLGDTPIHVLVSAQDLPGMSGLDAIREAIKRSPETIGILLAGTDSDDGLEALVSEKEVFQIVRGEISPGDLKELIDSATRQVRLLALAESANDQAASLDEPAAEHIVMETLDNGSAIISYGTETTPAFKPEKISLMPNAGGNQVGILVLTKDDEFLATIRDSARGLHNVHHANTPTQAEDIVTGGKIGILVTDAAMVGSNIEGLSQKLRKSVPRLVAVVAGRREDGEMLMDLINRGHVYRFLLKPVSPGRARLAIEASVKHHLEAAESAFKGKPKSATKPAAVKAAPSKSATPEKPKAKAKAIAKAMAKADAKPLPKAKPPAKAKAKPPEKAKAKPPAKAKAKPPAKAKAKPPEKAKAKPPAKAKPKLAPVPRPASTVITALPGVDHLSDPFEIEGGFGSRASGAKTALESSGGALAELPATVLRNPRSLAIAASLLAAIGVGYWVTGNWDSLMTESQLEDGSGVPTIVEMDVPTPKSAPDAPDTQLVSGNIELLNEARAARSSGHIYSPPGSNAIELYVAARSSAPHDQIVAAELEDVVDQTLGMIEKALLVQRTDDAAEALQLVRLADPYNSRLVFLDAQTKQIQLRNALDQARAAIRAARFEDAGNLIGTAEAVNTGDASEINALKQELSAARSEQQVDEVLALANQRLDENKLIAPPNDNARYYYQLALSNDPENAAAEQGMTIIASKLVLQARQAIDNDQFPLADTLLRDARALHPASSDLAASRSALNDARSRQEAEQWAAAERQAEAGRLAAERKAEADRLAESERRAKVARLAALERQAELERELEIQRQADAQKRAKLERQLAAQAEREAHKRADLERQLAVQAENEAQKRAKLERELETQRIAEADKRAKLERELGARKAADQKRTSAELAAAAVEAANAKSRADEIQRNDAAPIATNKKETIADANRARFDPLPEDTDAQTLAMNQVLSERRSAPVESNMLAAAIPSIGAENSATRTATETVASKPERVSISKLNQTKYVPPLYPPSAQRRNTSGWVDVSFTVSRDGSVHSIEIIESKPGTIFNDAAIKAISQWRFDPVTENGVNVEKQAAIRMMFSLQ